MMLRTDRSKIQDKVTQKNNFDGDIFRLELGRNSILNILLLIRSKN